MSELSKYPGPGFFFVTSRPRPGYLDEYHDWYETEHGPLRLNLDFIANGYRYKSRDLDPPLWAATYDLKRVSGLDEPQYKVLREKRSARESNLMDNKMDFIDRRVYKDISSWGHSEGPAPVIMPVTFLVKDELVEEVNRWYEEV